MDSFYTRTIKADNRFHSVHRIADLGLLEPRTRELVQAIVVDAADQGLKLMVYETYRSQERQLQLFHNGASKLQKVGVHHFGLACEIVRNVGAHPSWEGDFSLLGRLAYQYGLIWGGDWGGPNMKHTFVDAVHVQRCTIERQRALFLGTWYPDDAYNPYDDT